MKNKIFLVEDDSAILETLSIFLRHEGYDVICASGVADALDTLEVTQPDLLLLDDVLQGDTSEQVAEGLRRAHADVPLILFTGSGDPEARAEEMFADEFVAKPFELDVLLAKIRTCLDSRKCDMTLRDNLLGRRGGYDQADRKEIRNLP